ncbi:MAG: PfkB family carbohydrate kinase [Gammaproteobacteria bacterium]|nr:PfkB family carbohydrate kinase [Gammaproteobacteria bacterium]MDH5653879.1 PfkB family carbohydrate kinase [Gammaproteobacteria bacterium]
MTGHPVIFGEVLFDVFDDGRVVPGGAPFNVAWHLQGFGLAPILISRIGRDDLGQQIRQAMQDRDMITAGVQEDADYPTGQVRVTVQDGQPSFDIMSDAAYDHLNADAAQKILQQFPVTLFYHGSLIARTVPMLTLLQQLRTAVGTVFADINLRAPWWTRQQIETLSQGVTVLKVNDAELAILTDSDTGLPQLELSAQHMLDKYNLQKIIVTRGADGAFIRSRTELIQAVPSPVPKLVDTVGAGDGFSAVCILGLLAGWEDALTLQRAGWFAAQICQQQGATSNNPRLYADCRKDWKIS